MNLAKGVLLKCKKEAHGFLVSTDTQTSGRGRLGRSWISKKGNLLFSFCVSPDTTLSKASQLAFVFCIAMGDLLQEILPTNSKIMYKWPNDILVDDHKICGILLEAVTGKDNEFLGLVVGIGLNCFIYPSEAEILYPHLPATSLLERGAKKEDIGPQTVLSKLMPKLSFFYEYWAKNGFGHIRQLWLEKAKGKDQRLKVRFGAEMQEGIFTDLDAQGALLLETQNGRITVTAGDVFF